VPHSVAYPRPTGPPSELIDGRYLRFRCALTRMDAILRRLVTLEPPSLKVFVVETVLVLILRLPRRDLRIG